MKDTIDVSVRDSPKYGAFILAGIILGLVVGGIIWVVPKDLSSLPTELTPAAMAGFIFVMSALVGGFAGAIAALIIERVALRKAQRYTVNAEFEEVESATAEAPAATAAGATPAADAPADTVAAPRPGDSPDARLGDAQDRPLGDTGDAPGDAGSDAPSDDGRGQTPPASVKE